jgi:hypothetical protein
MQLMKPYFSTLASGKSGSKSVAQSKREAEHELWMRKNGVHPDQIKARKSKSGKTYSSSVFTTAISKPSTPDLSGLGLTGLKKHENVYTGKNLIGIAVMHKSCLQPIFNKQAAKDSANMRRS